MARLLVAQFIAFTVTFAVVSGIALLVSLWAGMGGGRTGIPATLETFADRANDAEFQVWYDTA
jgi:hypothetical protein